MPGNDGIPTLRKNYIGRHTNAELAALPVEKVRQGNWCWNISNARPEIYDGANWVPFGGGGPAGGGGFYQSGIDVYVAPTHPDAVDDGDLTTPFVTIQGALDAIGVPADLAEQKTRYAIFVEAGEYDEDLTIPEARILDMIAMGPVVLGDGNGDFFQSSTTPRSITYNVDQNHEFPDGPRPYLGLSTTQVQGAGRTIHNAYGSGWIISGTIRGVMTAPGGQTTHEIQLQQAYVQQGMDWAGAPGCGCNSYFDHCAVGPNPEDGEAIIGTQGGASFRIIWANETIFGAPYGGGVADVQITFWNRFTNCNFTRDLICTLGYVADPELAPGGMFECEIAGDYNSPGAFFIDSATYHNFRANGGALLGGATLSVIDGTQGLSVDGGAADFATHMDFISGANINITAPGPGQIQIDGVGGAVIPGGGDQEKPWDYHDVHALIERLDDMPFSTSNNGMASQRCVTMMQGSVEDGGRKILVLWHNGGSVLPGEGGTAALYLTVIHEQDNNPRKYSTYTYQMAMSDTDEIPLLPEPGDFCIVTEPGDGISEMVHVVFTAYRNTLGAWRNVYDAYFPTANIPYPPPAAIAVIPLTAEIVNQLDEITNEAFHPSASAQTGLSTGSGIVVTWTQKSQPGGVGFFQILGNVYDQTQPFGSRYASPTYPVQIVSDPASAYDAYVSACECDVQFCHCVYTMVAGAQNRLYYSQLPSTGLGAWSFLPAASPVDGANGIGVVLDCSSAPSVIVMRDMTIGLGTQIIHVAVGDANSNAAAIVLGFSADIIAAYPNPTYAYFDIASIYDDSHANDSNAEFFQLGISDPIWTGLVGSEPPILYLYKLMQTLKASLQLQSTKDFVLCYRPYGDLGQNNGPWAQLMLKSGIGERSTSSVRLSPTVHFSYNYYVRDWKEPDKAYFPINVYKRSQLAIWWDDDLQAWQFEPMAVMIIKDTPLYTLGQYTP